MEASGYAVFLRGVNVGGLRIQMQALRQAAEAAGFAGARTLLNSGNLLLRAAEEAEEVRARVDGLLLTLAGQPVPFMLRSLPQLEALLQEDVTEQEGYHHYLLFCERPLLQELAALYASYPGLPGERLFGAGQDLHWMVQEGRTLEGFGSKALGSAKYKALLTSRNLRTVQKTVVGLREMLQA